MGYLMNFLGSSVCVMSFYEKLARAGHNNFPRVLPSTEREQILYISLMWAVVMKTKLNNEVFFLYT